MKTRTKVALTALCALLLVVASVAGTLAYLTSNDTVTNTFTVGKVKITMDEAPTDVDGNVTSADPADRVKANALHLIPGSDYAKDPTIHVEANSEDAYLFVKIEDGSAAVQESDTVLEQLAANGWTAVPGKTNLYYQMHTQNANVVDYVVFETITIKTSATNDDLAALNGKIDVTAYAIQAENVADVDAACTALSL